MAIALRHLLVAVPVVLAVGCGGEAGGGADTQGSGSDSEELLPISDAEYVQAIDQTIACLERSDIEVFDVVVVDGPPVQKQFMFRSRRSATSTDEVDRVNARYDECFQEHQARAEVRRAVAGTS
jgi:hypothetical protein